MEAENRGIKRYTKPAFFPIYGILAGYILIHIVKQTTGIIPYEYFLFSLAGHGFTMADIFIITGASLGLLFWYLNSNKNKGEEDKE